MRIRLVTETNGHRWVGGLIQPDELPDFLDMEAALHEWGGWHVDRYGEMIRAEKGSTVRWIWPRSRSAMEDTL